MIQYKTNNMAFKEKFRLDFLQRYRRQVVNHLSYKMNSELNCLHLEFLHFESK